MAAIVAVTASRRRSAISLAGRRGWDEQFLLATISDIAGVTDPEESILTGLGGVRTVTNLRGISLVADDTWLGTVREGRGDDTRAREVAEHAAQAARHGRPTDSAAARPAGPVAVLVGAADRPLGALGADPGERRLSDDEYRMLELFAGVLTLALRREPGAGTARLDQP